MCNICLGLCSNYLQIGREDSYVGWAGPKKSQGCKMNHRKNPVSVKVKGVVSLLQVFGPCSFVKNELTSWQKSSRVHTEYM